MFCGIIKVVRNEVLHMSMTRKGTNKDLGFIIGTMEEYVPKEKMYIQVSDDISRPETFERSMILY